MSKGKKILDYGCGHGRVTRFLPHFFAPSKLVAADVTKIGVDFCAKEFGITPFLISDKNIISSMNQKFDVIICILVFSHLPPKSFEFNMIELHKILADNGLMVFTTNGEWFFKKFKLNPKDGYIFNPPGRAENETYGRLPIDEYGLMVVSETFVKRVLNQTGFSLVDFIPECHLGRQDVYVVELKNNT